ncbi:MAG: histidinol-phosphate transaminase [Anaerolineae bacterium]|nr:histidinol-phosphate transaminase [Anaerolineae bacterium]
MPRTSTTAVRIRPDIAAMEPYTPILPFEVLSERLGRPIDQIIKLDANENPYGPSPKALEALAGLGSNASIYPDPESRRLRAMLAGYVKVDAAYILVGAGADELIDLIMRLFIMPGDAIVNCPPTFGMYPFDAALCGARLVSVPRRADFSPDVEAIEQAAQENDAKLLFLCSPNNPDGGLIEPAELERLLALPLMVVLDEAYIEFSGAQSMAGIVPQKPNLIVLRTFSKWAGLAGLRVGYGIFPESLMAHLWKIKQPYNLNVAADVAARASLADLPMLMANVERIIAERGRLIEQMSAIPVLCPYPSRSNFILCKVVGPEAIAIKKQLEDQGILVRYYKQPRLSDHIRISVGTPEQSDALLKALLAISSQQEGQQCRISGT